MEKPSVAAQVRFGKNGEMEVDEEVDTDLSDWGLVEDEPERETRIEVEAASEFGIDDRTIVEQSSSEQETLVTSAADGQVTLGGEQAGGRSKW